MSAEKMDTRPLAARMRPETLDEFVGQAQLLAPGRPLRRMIEADAVPSMIFWGPPGVGKTTLANIIAHRTNANFVNFSAVTGSVKDIRAVMQEAEAGSLLHSRTIVFVDEIHRFNKAQQDAFLPFVEKGAITLIGATTENPSFEVNGALLSRMRVFVLKALDAGDLRALLVRALTDERGFGGQGVEMEDGTLDAIAAFANGDARSALSTLEMAVLNGVLTKTGVRVTRETLEDCLSRKSLLLIRRARSTTTSSRRCTSPCAIPTRTRPYTGWRGCWRAARIPYTLRAVWCASPARTWALPTRGRWKWRWRRIRPVIFWACPSAACI